MYVHKRTEQEISPLHGHLLPIHTTALLARTLVDRIDIAQSHLAGIISVILEVLAELYNDQSGARVKVRFDEQQRPQHPFRRELMV
jgi:hypothetical protein